MTSQTHIFLIQLTTITAALVLSTLAIETSSGNDDLLKNSPNVTSLARGNKTNLFVRSPPTKSLYTSGHGFHGHDNNSPGPGQTTKTLGPYPLRESYIAFEQAYPVSHSFSSIGLGLGGGRGGSSYEDYFKPSKFQPGSFGEGEFDAPGYFTTRLQNNYPPPPPPPPSLQYDNHNPYHHQFENQHHNNHHGHDPLYLPLPPPPRPPPFLRLVKIPDELKYAVVSNRVSGRNDLEITCEFPRYLLIAQQIYWHFIPLPTSLLLPYGTFYDSRNGFAPRVTVTSISKWTSVLTVRDYTEDDFGTYRCVSTAILPDEPYHPMNKPSYPSYPSYHSSYHPPTRPTYSPQSPSPPTSYLLNFPPSTFGEFRSASSPSTIASILENKQTEDDSPIALPSIKRERKIKFSRNKREIGVFGVHAPFFKPHYGIYRIFKEVNFRGYLGSGSDLMENVIPGPEQDKPEFSVDAGPDKKNKHKISNINKSDNEHDDRNDKSMRTGRRKFDFLFDRKSRVMF